MNNQLSRVVDALRGMVWTARCDGNIDLLNWRWCEHGRLRAAANDGPGATFAFSIPCGRHAVTKNLTGAHGRGAIRTSVVTAAGRAVGNP